MKHFKPKLATLWSGNGIVVLLLLLGAGLRLVGWGDVPPGLYHDEAYNGLDALKVLQGHFPLYFAANNGREPLFLYLIAASVGVLGRSPLAVRLPSFFVGFLTLAATYDLTRVLFNRRVARWAPRCWRWLWHIHLRRMGFRWYCCRFCGALFLAQAVRGESRTCRPGCGRHTLWRWYTMAARFTRWRCALCWSCGIGAVRWCLRGSVAGVSPPGVYTLQNPEIVHSRAGNDFQPKNPSGPFLEARHTWNTAAMFFIRDQSGVTISPGDLFGTRLGLAW